MKKICGVAIIILTAYISGYFALVEARIGFLSGIGPWPIAPHYLVGGKVAEAFFSPIHEIDRLARPEHWSFKLP